MNDSIPKPEFPSPRRRRSSIAQAAGLAGEDAPPTQDLSDRERTKLETAPTAPAASEARVPAKHLKPASGTGARARGATTHHGGVATATSPTSKRPVGSRDILLSVPEDLKERMVNTITWTQPHTGIGQQQKFIRKAILDLCERLEREHNQGNLFPPRVVSTD